MGAHWALRNMLAKKSSMMGITSNRTLGNEQDPTEANIKVDTDADADIEIVPKAEVPFDIDQHVEIVENDP